MHTEYSDVSQNQKGKERGRDGFWSPFRLYVENMNFNMLSDRCHWKIFSTECHGQDFDLGKKIGTDETHAQAELLNQVLQMWIREF